MPQTRLLGCASAETQNQGCPRVLPHQSHPLHNATQGIRRAWCGATDTRQFTSFTRTRVHNTAALRGNIACFSAGIGCGSRSISRRVSRAHPTVLGVRSGSTLSASVMSGVRLRVLYDYAPEPGVLGTSAACVPPYACNCAGTDRGSRSPRFDTRTQTRLAPTLATFWRACKKTRAGGT